MPNQATASDLPFYDIFAPQKIPLLKIFDDVIKCDLWLAPPNQKSWIRLCTVYCNKSTIQHSNFLNKIVQKICRAYRRFSQHRRWQFSKKLSAIQLKSIQTIQLKCFNVVNVGLIPYVWFFYTFLWYQFIAETKPGESKRGNRPLQIISVEHRF